jgi:hypothetical protein
MTASSRAITTATAKPTSRFSDRRIRSGIRGRARIRRCRRRCGAKREISRSFRLRGDKPSASNNSPAVCTHQTAGVFLCPVIGAGLTSTDTLYIPTSTLNTRADIVYMPRDTINMPPDTVDMPPDTPDTAPDTRNTHTDTSDTAPDIKNMPADMRNTCTDTPVFRTRLTVSQGFAQNFTV